MSDERPPEANEQSPSGRARAAPESRWKTAILIALILLVLLLAGIGVWLWRSTGPPKPALAYENNVVVGDLPGKTPEERQAELDQVVAEGMLSMSINATPSGSLSREEGRVNWLIENPSNQGKLIRVEVYLTDSDTKIYETGALRPGTYVESALLDEPLEPGTYDCTAVFYTYRLETQEYIGRAAAQVTLTLTE